MEACWAHNPEVRRSKLRSASYFFFLRTHDVPYPTRKGYGTEKRAGPISAEDSALDF